MDKEFLFEISKKLDVIINLLLNKNFPLDNSTPDLSKIIYLKELGLENSEIAKIMGKTPNNIRAVLSQKRKGETTSV